MAERPDTPRDLTPFVDEHGLTPISPSFRT
jgi:hypothetical protein